MELPVIAHCTLDPSRVDSRVRRWLIRFLSSMLYWDIGRRISPAFGPASGMIQLGWLEPGSVSGTFLTSPLLLLECMFPKGTYILTYIQNNKSKEIMLEKENTEMGRQRQTGRREVEVCWYKWGSQRQCYLSPVFLFPFWCIVFLLI